MQSADEKYNEKMGSLQQYIPFLNNMINQLKDPRKKNREQQLAKMVSLHSMITDKKRKLKLETLIKCEDVILKLYNKVKTSTTYKTAPITPSSPSPPPDVPHARPVVIPTEKVESSIYSGAPSSSDVYHTPKINIYSSAVVHHPRPVPAPKAVPDPLRSKVPDMSKPPISIEDLKELASGPADDVDALSLHELTDLRAQLQQQLVAPAAPAARRPPADGASVFGSALSRIDAQLLERPVYRRLADKYNPRPRKASTETPRPAAAGWARPEPSRPAIPPLMQDWRPGAAKPPKPASRDPRANRAKPPQPPKVTYPSIADDYYPGAARGSVQNFKIPKLVKREPEQVSSSTELTPSREHVEESSEITSTNTDANEKTETKLETNDQSKVINQFLQQLLEDKRTQQVATSLIETVSNSLSDNDGLRQLVQTIQAAKEDEAKKVGELEAANRKRETKLRMRQVAERRKREAYRRKARARARPRRRVVKKIESSEEEEEEPKAKRAVGRPARAKAKPPEKVGEKPEIRARKRTKQKSELDLLHQDIQDMFIRDGVLTATGKRACRVKDEERAKGTPSPEASPRRRRRARPKSADASPSTKNREKLKQMTAVRVVVTKLDLEADENKRYSLRRTKSKSYVENDNSDVDEKREIKKEIKVEPEEPRRRAKRKLPASPSAAKREKVDESGVDLVEPDRNYFTTLSWQYNARCKICPFNGRHLTNHYKFSHPESEVLSSRLRPMIAEEAKLESERLRLDDKPEVHISGALSQRYNYKCRFCDAEIHNLPTHFYDHVTTHTGEYRHLCNYCTYSASNSKSMRLHFDQMHPGKARVMQPKRPVTFDVTAWMCIDCNFVQFDRKTIENHVNIYHLGEGKKMVRIYPTSIIEEPVIRQRKKRGRKVNAEREKTDDEDESEKDEEEGEEEEEEEEEVEDEEDAETDEPPKLEPEVEKPFKSESVQPSEKNVIDMTVFTCQNESDDEPEQKKMEDNLKTLNESVTLNRLNFVDELSDRLLKESEDEVGEEDMELEDTNPCMDQGSIVQLSKPRQGEDSEVKSSEQTEKPNVFISEIVEKLQRNLESSSEPTITGPPKLIPLVKAEASFVRFGLLEIVKRGETYELACRVPSCVYSSGSRTAFLQHWTGNAHPRFDSVTDATTCLICTETIVGRDGLLGRLWAHVEREHLLQTADEEVDFERTVSASIEESELNERDQSFGLAQREGLKVRRDVFEVLADLDGRADKMEEEGAAGEDALELDDENPFGFKICEVVSLAGASTSGTKRTNLHNAKITIFALKEVQMDELDKGKKWKCAVALGKFQNAPEMLYKCPQFNCDYMSNNRTQFDVHLQCHTFSNDDFVACVYCDVKTLVSQAGQHIDRRHAQSLWACPLCLYRGYLPEYVVVHLRKQHSDHNEAIVVKISTLADVKRKAKHLNEHSDRHYSIQEACPPYSCRQKGCKYDFLFRSEFIIHLIQNHCNETFFCGYNKGDKCDFTSIKLNEHVDHWQDVHCCYSYNCLYCKQGTKTIYQMLEHYSDCHTNLMPKVVSRKDSPKESRFFYTGQAFTKVTYLREKQLKDSILHDETDTSPTLKLIPLKTLTQQPAKKLYAVINANNQQRAVAIHLPAAPDATPPPADDRAAPSEIVFASTDARDPPAPEAAAASVDPLSFETGARADGDRVPCEALYRCGGACGCAFASAKLFKAHLVSAKACHSMRGDPTRVLKCAHCARKFRTAHDLFEHILYHGPLRFHCCLCERKFSASIAAKVHMRKRHNVTGTITTPLNPQKTNLDIHDFVIRPQPIKCESPDPAPSAAHPASPAKHPDAHKTTFLPTETDTIPNRNIFNYELRCGLCSFQSKVRMNLVRHLELHIKDKNFAVPSKAPVNPVPCLEKNERMFDKMTNLAISSFAGRPVKREPDAVPEFVPAARRFACGAPHCAYLCPEEGNLRHHLHALHAAEPALACAHCRQPLDADAYVPHLRLHGATLFRCAHCPLVHERRARVERHAAERHGADGPEAVVVRLAEGEEGAPEKRKSWYCGICKHRAGTEAEVRAHASGKHNLDMQYKCALCQRKSNDKGTFAMHFVEAHQSSEVDIIDVYYNEEAAAGQSDEVIDTTPLWQRDRPRVRHIRGILFEDGPSGSGAGGGGTTPKLKRTNSRSVLVERKVGCNNLDMSIDAVAKGTNEDDAANDSGDGGGAEGGEEVCDSKFITYNGLIRKYGISAPRGNYLLCSFCQKYKTRRICYFVYHLLNELKCHRYSCQSCDYKCLTIDTLQTHYNINHNAIYVGNFTDVALDENIIFWLQTIIEYQTTRIVATYHNGQIIKGEEEASALCKSQCPICLQWFKSIHHQKDHEFYHWSFPTYRCSHCPNKTPKISDFFAHSTAAHPHLPPRLDASATRPHVAHVLAALRRPAILGSGVALEPRAPDPDEPEEARAGRAEPLFSCSACHARDARAPMERHLAAHAPAAGARLYQFICLHCPCAVFANIRGVYTHFAGAHPQLGKVTYATVDNRAARAGEQYACTRCVFASASIGHMRAHMRKHVRPFDCGRCGERFVTPGEGRAHAVREHKGMEDATVENQERLAEYEGEIAVIVSRRRAEPTVGVKKKMVARKSTSAPVVKRDP